MQDTYTREKEIRGHIFETRLLGIDAAEEVLVKLGNMGGFGLASISLPKDAKTNAIGAIAGAITQSLGGVLTRLSPADVRAIRKLFLAESSVKVDGVGGFAKLELVQEKLFRGNATLMYEWLAFCFEVNFGGFFPELRAKITELIALALKPEDDETTAAGDDSRPE